MGRSCRLYKKALSRSVCKRKGGNITAAGNSIQKDFLYQIIKDASIKPHTCRNCGHYKGFQSDYNFFSWP